MMSHRDFLAVELHSEYIHFFRVQLLKISVSFFLYIAYKYLRAIRIGWSRKRRADGCSCKNIKGCSRKGAGERAHRSYSIG